MGIGGCQRKNSTVTANEFCGKGHHTVSAADNIEIIKMLISKLVVEYVITWPYAS